MQVVALVSGGKDSTFNMMLCAAYGHDVVALANLHPPAPEDGSAPSEEMDSFMYQTAGHALIPALAECAGLPLFRQPIRGTAVHTGLAYTAPGAPRGEGGAGDGGAAGTDEVEDLYALLTRVLEAFPGVRGVSVGAIASDYQRVRVESVCARLGLTALAYLWAQPQPELLTRMLGAGVDAVLCKVACLGLTPRAHLGAELAHLRPHLDALAAQYGVHVCGEGGEYETLTRWCPLWARRLRLVRTEALTLDDGGGIAPVGVLRVQEHAIEPVPDAERHAFPPLERRPPASVAPPPACAPQPRTAWRAAPRTTPSAAAAAAAAAGEADASEALPGDVHCAAHAVGRWVAVAVSVSAPSGGVDAEAAAAATAATLEAAEAALEATGAALSDVLITRLYLADMAHYAAVNRAFGAAFSRARPAARAAVAVPLARVGASVRLELLARAPPPPPPAGGASAGDGAAGAAAAGAAAGAAGSHKRVLHVQSVSEWAPRMIGPYAQAAWVDASAEQRSAQHGPAPSLGCVAGSIGLHPPTMALVGGGAGAQAAQALANVDAVLRVLGRTPRDALSCLLYHADADAAAAAAASAVEHRTSGGGSGGEGGDGDGRARQHARAQLEAWAARACAAEGDEQRGDEPPAPAARAPPLCAGLLVSALPMGAACEALVDSLGENGGGPGAGMGAPAPAPAAWQWAHWAEEGTALGQGGASELVLRSRALWRRRVSRADGGDVRAAAPPAGGAATAARPAAPCDEQADGGSVGTLCACVCARAAGEPSSVELEAVVPALAAAWARLAAAAWASASEELHALHATLHYDHALGAGFEAAVRATMPAWEAGAHGGPCVQCVPVHAIVEPAGCCVLACVYFTAQPGSADGEPGA